MKEVIVFDDFSSDSTRELPQSYPQIHWILSPTPLGYVYGRNLLMSETDAEYYCSLDDDSWFLEGNELHIAVSYLESHPKVAAIAFDILSPDRPDKRIIGLPYETNMYIGCGHVLRVSSAKEMGLYYTFPGFYGGEEKDLCLSLINAGYQIIRLPGINVWHDKTPVARDLPKQYRSVVFNDLVFTFRRTPSLYLLLALVIKFLKHLKFSILFREQNLVRPCLLSFKDFLLLLLTKGIERKPVLIRSIRKFVMLSR